MMVRSKLLIVIFTILLILILAPLAQAAPPRQTPDETGEAAEAAGAETQNHPVAARLANFFGVDYNEVMGLHQAGYGFGNIVKAYYFTNQIPGMSPEALLVAAQSTGWGNLLKANGIHPGAKANGKQWSQPGQPATNAAGQEVSPANQDKPGNGPPDHAGPPGGSGPPGQVKKLENNGQTSTGPGNSNRGGNRNENGDDDDDDDLDDHDDDGDDNGADETPDAEENGRNNGNGNGNSQGRGNN